MKARLIVIFTIILFLSCSREASQELDNMWTPVDREFDSIAYKLQNSFLDFAPDSVKDSLLYELSSVVSRRNNKRVLKARLHYWRGRVMIKRNMIEEAKMELEKARRLTDSADFPYDMARIRYEENLTKSIDVMRQYKEDREALQYYSAIGDSVMIGAIYISMGSTFRDIADTVRSLDYFSKADEIFQLKGYENLRLLTLLNMSNLYPRQEADSILGIVRLSEKLKDNEPLNNMVLFNSYIYTDSLPYLYKLLSNIRGKEEHKSGVAHVEALIATKLFERKIDLDSAVKLSRHSWSLLEKDDELTTKVVVTQALTYALKSTGKIDSAYYMLEQTQDLYNEWMERRRSNDVLAMENKIDIDSVERMYDMERQETRILFGGIGLSILLIAFVFGVFFYLRSKNARLSQEKAEMEMEKANIEKEKAFMEMERNKVSLAASKLVLEGKDKAMESVGDIISNLKENNKISPEVAGVISSELKIYMNDKDELESFQDIHTKLNPNFVRSLKELCPDLTEGQLRLASYIAMGMTNRQIARMLGVEQTSVVKNRYRMRAKLGLAKGDSLEDKLRSLS